MMTDQERQERIKELEAEVAELKRRLGPVGDPTYDVRNSFETPEDYENYRRTKGYELHPDS
jgi:hypothetical protein